MTSDNLDRAPGLNDQEDAAVTLRARLRQRREALGMTQEQVGEILGYTGESRRQAVSKYENGKLELTIGTLLKYADALQMDASDLLGPGIESPYGVPTVVHQISSDHVVHPDKGEDAIPIITCNAMDAAKHIKRVVGYAARPPSLRGVRDAYAIYAPDDSMEPRYDAGWLLYVNPAKPARTGRDVLIYRKGGPPAVRRLERSGGETRGVALGDRGGSLDIASSEITEMHLIVGSDQEG